MSFHDRLGSFPILETPRLVLREARPDEDAEIHHRLWSDPRVIEFTPNRPVESREQSMERLRRLKGWFYDETYILGWVIALRDTDQMIGGLRYYKFMGHEFRIGEIGYEVLPEHWGKGYMTEALRAAVAFGFERIGLSRIQITTNPANTASQRVAIKAGFRQEGTLRSWDFNERIGRWQDAVVFSVLPGEVGV